MKVKLFRDLVFMLCVSSLVVLMGCEWESSGDDDSWNDAYSWLDFSGVYRDRDGQYLVAAHGLATPVNDSQALGTGNGGTATFTGTLNNRPVVAGSASVTDGAETFTDNSAGVLTGSQNGTGSIVYDTGAISVDFFQAPSTGRSVIVSYQYYGTGTAENPQSGSSGAAIFSLLVSQQGQRLTFTDSNGATYSGLITVLRSDAGDSSPQSDAFVIGQFEVKGTSSNGQTITITGTFSGDYTYGALDGSTGLRDPSFLENRRMSGTWIEASGQTGDIDAITDSTILTTEQNTSTTTTTTTTPAASP